MPSGNWRKMESQSNAERRPALHALCCIVFAVLAGVAALAADPGSYQSKDGIAVYLGVLPAAMILGHPKDHLEPAMHGGVPSGRGTYHVVAAVFDAASGERIENAKVEARVSPPGLSGIARPLEPMQIAGTVTYGNYFTIRDNEPYRILISVTQGAKAITLEFSHEHRTH